MTRVCSTQRGFTVPREYVVYSVGPDMNHRVLNPDGSILVRSRFSKLNRYDPSNGLYS
ncbi:MAG TPA: hypothetical protein PK878_20565 [bacterium]|nr:hypothetical protein [bacterium]HXK92861.1 hypothetical protein [bacterium]